SFLPEPTTSDRPSGQASGCPEDQQPELPPVPPSLRPSLLKQHAPERSEGLRSWSLAWQYLSDYDGPSSLLPLQLSVGTLPASWNTWTTFPVVNACTTAPLTGSTSAVASRTSMPVILLISCRSESQELANSCR